MCSPELRIVAELLRFNNYGSPTRKHSGSGLAGDSPATWRLGDHDQRAFICFTEASQFGPSADEDYRALPSREFGSPDSHQPGAALIKTWLLQLRLKEILRAIAVIGKIPLGSAINDENEGHANSVGPDYAGGAVSFCLARGSSER
jgi:hypothetical protein